MKSLLDLSKELGLRAENLRARLAELGISVEGLDAPLDEDTETLLRSSLGRQDSWLSKVVQRWFGTREDVIDSLFAEAVGEQAKHRAPEPIADLPPARPREAPIHSELVQREPLDDIPELPPEDWLNAEDRAKTVDEAIESESAQEPAPSFLEREVPQEPPFPPETVAAAPAVPVPAEAVETTITGQAPAHIETIAGSPATPGVKEQPLAEQPADTSARPAESDELTLDDLENISLSELVQEEATAETTVSMAVENDQIDLEAMLAAANKPPPPSAKPAPAPEQEMDVEAFLGLSLDREPEPEAGKAPIEQSGLSALIERWVPPRLRKVAVPLAVVALAVLLIVLVAAPQMFMGPRGSEQELLEQASLSLREGKTAVARKNFEQIVKYYPNSPQAATSCYALGHLEYEEGRWLSALARYQEAVKRSAAEARTANQPLSFQAWDGLARIGRCLVRLERYESAIQHYEKIVTDYPHRNPEARYRETLVFLGDLYYEWAQKKKWPDYLIKSNDAYTQYLKDYPDAPLQAPVFYRLGRNFEALARTSPQKAELAFQEAIANYNASLGAGQNREYGYGDLQPLKILLALGGAWRSLGEFYTETGADTTKTRSTYDIGRRILETVLQTKPGGEDEKRARVDLAWCYLGVENAQAAIEATNNILRDYREGRDKAAMAAASYIQGDAYGLLNQREKACMAYKDAIRISPDAGPNKRYSQRARMRLTNYLYFDKQQWEDAAANYEEIIRFGKGESGPYTMRALYNLGLCYQNLGEYEKAIHAFDQLVKAVEKGDFKPFDERDLWESALFQIGRTLYLGNRFGECLAGYEVAFKQIRRWSSAEGYVYPKSDKARMAFLEAARAARRLEIYPKAVEYYRQVLKDFPEADADGAIALELAQVLQKTFAYADARDVYESVARKHSSQPETVREALLGLARSYEEEALSSQKGPQEFQALLTKAVNAYEGLRKITGSDPQNDGKIGLLYQQLNKYSESNQYLNAYLKHMEKSGAEKSMLDRYRHASGINWLRLNDPARAVQAFDLMTGQDRSPEGIRHHAEALIESARYFLKIDALDEAEKRYQKLVNEYAGEAADNSVVKTWVDDARGNLERLAWKKRTSKVLASS